MGYEDFSGRLIFTAEKIKNENENENENKKNKKNISRGPTMILEFRKKLRNLTEMTATKNVEKIVSSVLPMEIVSKEYSVENNLKAESESVLLSINENNENNQIGKNNEINENNKKEKKT